MNKPEHAVAIGWVLVDHLDVCVEDCAMDLYYGPMGLSIFRTVRIQGTHIDGVDGQVDSASQALRTDWEYSQLPPIVRFVPRLMEINLRVWAGWKVGPMFSFFLRDVLWRSAPMGFVFRSSCESQAILNFKSHTECHRLTRKQHARSSLMTSLASICDAASRVWSWTVVLSLYKYIYVVLLSIEDHGVYNWDRVALGYGYCMSNCSWHGRLSLPT